MDKKAFQLLADAILEAKARQEEPEEVMRAFFFMMEKEFHIEIGYNEIDPHQMEQAHAMLEAMGSIKH